MKIASHKISVPCLQLVFLIGLVAALVSTSPGQNFKVTLLGTGYPRPRIDRFGPSTLVEAGKQKLLFDCGRGASIRLYQLNTPFEDVDALFLTHLHSDHIVGLPDLWLTGWILGRKTPLRVWGPEGTKAMMTHLEEAYAFDIHVRRDVDEQLTGQGWKVQATDIQEGIVYQNEGVKVTAFNVEHGRVKPAFGYRVDYGGHSVVLSGDTHYSENLIKFSQGADVLIHEVLDPERYLATSHIFNREQMQRVMDHHTTPEQAGRVFSRVKPRLAVYSHVIPGDVPHLIAETRKTYSGPLEVGEDLMSIEIGEKIEVHQPTK